MKEVFDFSFAAPNIFPTLLLLIVMMYWIVFLLGFLDLSFLDIDAGGKDFDVDAGHDVGHDAGHDHDIGGKSFSVGVLDFLNLTHVPFMIFFSFFALFYWALSVLGNYYLSEGSTGLILLVLVGGIVAALLVTKLVTQPLRTLFKKLEDDDAPLELRGQTCRIEVGVEGERIGQADLTVRGRNLLIHVRAIDNGRLARGMECLIITRSENGEFYYVEPLHQETTNPTL